jgi:Wiskott-Aldrich syndrome protein
MDGDIDMDAPQISTLRDEETPPPTRTSKFRVKLLINDSKGAASSSSRKQGEDEDEDEDEDEEDQLIDDDDDDNSINPNPLTSSARPLDVPGKRRPSHKRKPRKSEKRIVEDERQARAKEDVRPGMPSSILRRCSVLMDHPQKFT